MSETKEVSSVSEAMQRTRVRLVSSRQNEPLRQNLQLLKIEPHGRSYTPGYPIGGQQSEINPLDMEADVLLHPKRNAVEADGKTPLKDADGNQLKNADLVYYHHNTSDCGTEPIGENEAFELATGGSDDFDIEAIFAGPNREPDAPAIEPATPNKPAKVEEAK